MLGPNESIHMRANVNVIVQAIESPINIQAIILNLGVEKMRLYIRRTLILVIPTAGHVNSSRAYIVCVGVIRYYTAFTSHIMLCCTYLTKYDHAFRIQKVSVLVVLNVCSKTASLRH